MKEGDIIGGRFFVDALAGRGAMAEVYRARDAGTNAPVAVKVFKEKTRKDPRVTRFLREAEVLEKLRHPGIVEHVAHGVNEDGTLYIAMEWLDGEDLRAVLGRGTMSIEEVVGVAKRVAAALAVAHESGVIHRDVKPENIFLVGSKLTSVKLLAFGIAALGGGQILSRASEPIGTPAYMAPEQAKGLKVDTAADVFSLGCVLFECLTGKPPFWAEHPLAIMAKIVLDEAAKIAALRPDIPDEVAALVDGMLAKDPKGRPQNGRAVLDAIDEIPVASLRPVPDAPGSVRKPASVPSAKIAFGARERQLVSVMLIAALENEGQSHESSPTMPAVGVSATPAEAVVQEVTAYGGVAERLVDGTMVITLGGKEAAGSRAESAAQCALAVRRILPNLPMVLVTGRTDGSAGSPVGEVVERGVALLSGEIERFTADNSCLGVCIDDVTAGLLDRHFAVANEAPAFRLLGEGDPREAARALGGQTATFVGREGTIEELCLVFDEVVETNEARAVVVTAPGGFGKSRLQQELLGWLSGRHASISTLVGRGDFSRRSSALAVVAGALADFFGLREGEDDDESRKHILGRVARHIRGADRDRIAALLGELVAVPFPGVLGAHYEEALQDRARLFDHIRNAFHDLLGAELAHGPVVWVLDDLHEADEASVSFVASALRTFASSPLMVLALARPELDTRFGDLWAESNPIHVTLGPLAPDAAAKLVRMALGDDARDQLVETIVARAQGNVFFLEELVRAVADGRGDALPQTLFAVVEALLGALPGIARRVLRCASVFGTKFSVTGLRALLPEGSDRDLQAAIDELVDRELLSRTLGSSSNPFRAKLAFRSEIVRAACYEELTNEDRAHGHRLAGEWLESVGGVGNASEIANHYSYAGEKIRAATWFLKAADLAMEQAAFTEALAASERAAASGAAGLMLARSRLMQAEAMRHLGDSAGMLEKATAAMGLVRPRTPGWWTAVADALGGAVDIGNLQVASGIAKEIAGGPLAVSADAARAAIELFPLGRYDEANTLLEAIAPSKGGSARTAASGPPLREGWVRRALACRAMYATDLAALRTHSEKAVELFEKAGEAREAAAELVTLGFVREELGLYPEAEDALRASLAISERLVLPRVTAMCNLRLGSVLMRLGRSDEAERCLNSSIAMFQKHHNRRMEGLARRQLGLLEIDRGGLDPAFREIMHASQLLSSYPPLLPMALAACARVLLATGGADEALLMAADAVAALAKVKTVDEGEAFTYLIHAEALRASGRTDAADTAIRSARTRLLQRATQLDAPSRPNFLNEVRENRRTSELALEWTRGVPAMRAAPAPIAAPVAVRKAKMRLATTEPEPDSPKPPPVRKPPPAPRRVTPTLAFVLSGDAERRAKLDEILGANGAHVHAASSPGELFYLLESAEEAEHVVVFLDPLTPGLEGPSFVDLLRQKEALANARIVLAGGLTVKMMRDSTEAWAADGFVAMVDGPVDPETALKRWLVAE